VLVTDWVRGRCWTRAEAMTAVSTAHIATLARRIHALSPPPPRYARQPAGWIRHYSGICGRDRAAPRHASAALADEAARRLETLARLPRSTNVLCHSDLHRFNLIDGPAGLIVLDWEYAHFSDPFWDLAGWLCANDLAGPHCELLLAAYLGRAPGRAQMRRLACLMWLYDYVCVLWSDAYRGQFTAAVGAGVSRRARKLALRLGKLTAECAV
jgi:aminoglycoside phosphotransferase (APT) family kinase protein